MSFEKTASSPPETENDDKNGMMDEVVTRCKYSKAGCLCQGTKDQLDKHCELGETNHLALSFKCCLDLSKENDKLYDDIEKCNQTIESLTKDIECLKIEETRGSFENGMRIEDKNTLLMNKEKINVILNELDAKTSENILHCEEIEILKNKHSILKNENKQLKNQIADMESCSEKWLQALGLAIFTEEEIKSGFLMIPRYNNQSCVNIGSIHTINTNHKGKQLLVAPGGWLQRVLTEHQQLQLENVQCKTQLNVASIGYNANNTSLLQTIESLKATLVGQEMALHQNRQAAIIREESILRNKEHSLLEKEKEIEKLKAHVNDLENVVEAQKMVNETLLIQVNELKEKLLKNTDDTGPVVHKYVQTDCDYVSALYTKCDGVKEGKMQRNGSLNEDAPSSDQDDCKASSNCRNDLDPTKIISHSQKIIEGEDDFKTDGVCKTVDSNVPDVVLDAPVHDSMLSYSLPEFHKLLEKTNESSYSFLTEVFYTGNPGYKCQFRIKLCDNKLGFDFRLLKGIFDEKLQWPFRKSIVLLVNSDALNRKQRLKAAVIDTSELDLVYISKPLSEKGNPAYKNEMYVNTSRFIEDRDELIFDLIVQ